jgi:hypothetical protein
VLLAANGGASQRLARAAFAIARGPASVGSDKCAYDAMRPCKV